MSAQTIDPNPRSMHLEQTVLRGAIWAIVGVVFGFLFVVLSAYLDGIVSPPLLLLASTVGASGITALFYASMRLTVMVANFTFIAMVFYTWGNTQLTLEPLIYIGAIVGLVVGTIYGAKERQSRIFCAEAKIVAGLFSGVLAALLGYLPGLVFNAPAHLWAAMIGAPAAILMYVTSAHWFVDRCHRFLPPVVNGGLVGTGVGAATGLLFMIMAGTLDPTLLGKPYHLALVEHVGSIWLSAVAGAAASCFLVGVLRSLLRVRWYNL